MALASYALVDWPTVKEYLNLDDSEQTRAELIINAASETANQYADHKLAASDYTHDLDGHGNSILMLPEFPINSVIDVYADAARNFGPSTEVTDYLIYSNEGYIVREFGIWPRKRKSVRINYNAGYTPVPSNVQFAVLEVIDYNWRRIVSQSIGVRTMSGDGVSTEFELTIPTNAQRTFESYKRDFL